MVESLFFTGGAGARAEEESGHKKSRAGKKTDRLEPEPETNPVKKNSSAGKENGPAPLYCPRAIETHCFLYINYYKKFLLISSLQNVRL